MTIARAWWIAHDPPRRVVSQDGGRVHWTGNLGPGRSGSGSRACRCIHTRPGHQVASGMVRGATTAS